MAANYWANLSARPLNRRNALKSAAALALGAGSLALGCRDDGEDAASSSVDKSGLLRAPEDTTTRAMYGGSLPAYFAADVPGFDGMTSLSGLTTLHNEYAYARLLNFHVFNVAKGEKLDGTLDPYAAESWEMSADGTQYTFKMRPEGGLDPRPPTNGRVLDAEDVVFSWNRFKATHRSRGLLAHEVNPSAPIISIVATDRRTVTIKLAFPSASVLSALAFSFYLMIQPREADGGFDPRQTMRGSGPWMLADHQPSVSFTYRKNPNFYRSDRPFMDGIDAPIVAEYTQGVAQLRAGNLYSYPVRQEDVVPIKESTPSLDLLTQDTFNRAAAAIVFFSLKPGSIFRDDRIRQAMSMLIDRDLYIETAFNASKFEAQGLPAPRRWATIMPIGEDSYWLDPQSDQFGPNARYYEHNPGEAKKLVRAAAGNLPIKEQFTYIGGNEYGGDYRKDAEILQGMWQANGDFELKTNIVDYNAVFLPKYSIDGPGRTFDGGGVAIAGVAPFPEPDVLLGEWYMRGGTYYKFESDYPNDPRWESLMKAQRSELDPKRRLTLLSDIQRYHAGKMYTIHRPGATLGYALKQPWLANAGAFISASSQTFAGNANASTSGLHWWLDRPKRP